MFRGEKKKERKEGERRGEEKRKEGKNKISHRWNYVIIGSQASTLMMGPMGTAFKSHPAATVSVFSSRLECEEIRRYHTSKL